MSEKWYYSVHFCALGLAEIYFRKSVHSDKCTTSFSIRMQVDVWKKIVSILNYSPFVSISVELLSKLVELFEWSCSAGDEGGEWATVDSVEFSTSSLLNSNPKLSANPNEKYCICKCFNYNLFITRASNLIKI